MPVPPATIVIARTPASAASRRERALAGPARHTLQQGAVRWSGRGCWAGRHDSALAGPSARAVKAQDAWQWVERAMQHASPGNG
jgi:hypothetical protein